MADSLTNDQGDAADNWFSLNVTIMTIQAVAFLGIGIPLAWPVIQWFGIPPGLQVPAFHLLLVLICVNSAVHPFRICAGIMFAQNRAYLPNLVGMVSAFVNLTVFTGFLMLGYRTLAYGFAFIVSSLFQAATLLVLLKRGPHSFRFNRVKIWSSEVKEMFQFSTGLFFISIAVQVVMASQTLILTKALGLAAVAAFTVCSKAPLILMQILWRPFDAFAPRWQEFYIRNDFDPLRREFLRLSRLTVATTIAAVIAVIALNHVLVAHWTRPELHLGRGFDILLGLYLLVHSFNHCLCYPFVLAKDTKMLARNAAVEAVVNIVATWWAVKVYGVHGLLMASILCSLGITSWIIAIRGPKYIGLTFTQVIRSWVGITPIAFLLLAFALWNFYLPAHPLSFSADLCACALAALLVLVCVQPDILFVWKRFRSRA